ncbi:17037_t:CDS:2 [Gigaspora rosea]|nr:17037_t:CDS:2 [Gigaspora rosea]
MKLKAWPNEWKSYIKAWSRVKQGTRDTEKRTHTPTWLSMNRIAIIKTDIMWRLHYRAHQTKHMEGNENGDCPGVKT